MELRRRQNEDYMRGRLLERFQQRVEGAGRQHMHLVDDVHTLFEHRRGIDDLFAQVADVFHTVVAGCVDFQNVGRRARIDGAAIFAAVAGVAVLQVQTVGCLGQNFRRGRLACPTRAAEEVGVRNAAAFGLIPQHGGNVVLPAHIAEGLRTPFSV